MNTGILASNSASTSGSDSLEKSQLDHILSVEGKLFVVDNALDSGRDFPTDLQNLVDVDRVRLVSQQDKHDSSTDYVDLLAVE